MIDVNDPGHPTADIFRDERDFAKGDTMMELSHSDRPTWLDKVASAVTRLPVRAALALDGLREKAALKRELQYLDENQELDRVLSDVGLTHGELPTLLQAHPGAARQFTAMMARIGVDAARLSKDVATSAALRDMEQRCASCEAWRECRDWFAFGPADDRYRHFCPNGRALEDMRDAQSSAAAPDRRPAERSGILRELDESRGQGL